MKHSKFIPLVYKEMVLLNVTETDSIIKLQKLVRRKKRKSINYVYVEVLVEVQVMKHEV